MLLTPGPTPVPEEVLAALSLPLIHHRTDEYRAVFREVTAGLQKVFRTRNSLFTFSSSGTGAMEAAVVNFLSRGDEILVLACGKFSERFAEISRAYGVRCDVMKVPYGEAADPVAVDKELGKKNYRAVYAALCETSTGIVNDIEAIGKIVAKTEAILAVDAISGLLADRLETDAWQVDVAIGASQKALGVPPGLAFLSVSPKAWRCVPGADLPRYYLDLAKYEKAFEKGDTPFTPAIQLTTGLARSLAGILADGVERCWENCAGLAVFTRELCRDLGLTLFPKRPSNAMTAAWLPEGFDGGGILGTLRREYGVFFAGGQGESLKGKLLRIGHMGAVREEDIRYGMECLKEVLVNLGYRSDTLHEKLQNTRG